MNKEQLESIAMNIVYQLGDFYTLSTELRNSTNDEAIAFVEKLIKEKLEQQKKPRTKQTIPEKTIYWGETSAEEMDWEEANDWCEEQGGRLPTLIELLQANPDYFVASYYWSATEFTSLFAYYVNFSNCTTFFNFKTNALNVRCVFDKLNK